MKAVRFIAEFTTNPMGNLNLLLKMTEAAADAGCTLIKMQKKDVKSFYSPEKLATPYDSPFGKTYGEYREMFEFSKEDFDRFDKKCRECGVGWFSTAQDAPSLEFLLQYDLPIYKIASTNIRNKNLMGAFLSEIPKDKEVVVSTGGATLEEIENAVNLLHPFKKINILHCVAEYPCKDSHCRLGNIPELKRRFESETVSIGYSGHEEGIIPSLVAVGLGADMIERHFCISRTSFVHHIECSLEPEEYREMVQRIKNANSREALVEQYRGQLDEEAFKTQFNMSDMEKSFLLDKKYGREYMGDHSEINGQ